MYLIILFSQSSSSCVVNIFSMKIKLLNKLKSLANCIFKLIHEFIWNYLFVQSNYLREFSIKEMYFY